jgi:asparagine synthase (glutamine-hydrolysing)
VSAAGLLGWHGVLPPERLAAALGRAPWRGPAAAELVAAGGAVLALGAAHTARRGPLALALHGRLDNQAALAGELGADPADPAAVAAAAYLRFGDEAAARLLGDFALLILDDRRGALLAARDWVGARPLFWGRAGNLVACGSEVKQVLALLGLPLRPDEDNLDAYARADTPPLEATFVAGVRAVPPNGQVLAAPPASPLAWRRPLRFAPVELALPEAAAAVRGALEVAVARRTAEARRLGAFVSGGMDSTSVAATAAALAARGAGPPLAAAFTTHYPEVPACDETAYARRVAEHWAVPWSPVPFAPAEVFEGLEPAFALHDGPIFPAATSIGKTMDAARADGVDVLLTGQVGDDWLEQSGDELSLALLRGDWGALGRWTAFGLRQRGWRGPVRTGGRLARAMRNRLRGDRAESLFENRAANFYLRSALETEEREGLIRNIRVEFPFCDRELAALLAGLRPGVRAAVGVPKGVLREAMAGRLPEAVRGRRDVTYFDPLLAAAVDGNDPVLVSHRYADAWRRQLGDLTVAPS